ncbi:MAG: glycosyl hydrolase family 28-related protein [Planctomycetota bacterium]|nr:glycosyl hydrolase family 28-related protein [Planctomycetota bacterium]
MTPASVLAAAEKPEILWASDPIRPGETVLIQGHAFTPDVVVEASPAPGKPMRALEVLDRHEQCLKALLPADWAPGIFELRVTTRGGQASWLLNRPASVFWVGDLGKRQTPGGRFRICGRNMLGDPKGVRARVTGPRSVDVPVEKAEAFALTALRPPDVPSGEYSLQVHNGWGQDAGWSDPVAFVVAPATPWPQTVFNVKDFGAQGKGLVDDTAAVQAALAKAAANGGGIVFFPRGRYEIRDMLTVPRFTVLRGARREWVELMWADGPTPVVLVKGTNSFGVEEISLSSRNYADGIVGDTGLVPGAGDVFLRRVRVRAMRYIRQGPEQCFQRHLEACKVREQGGITILLGGQNIEITDCDVFGSGRVLELGVVIGGRITGNTFTNGCQGWYCIAGSNGLIFENNEIVGGDLQSAGGGLNTFYDWRSSQDVYFAHNRLRMAHGGDREGLTSDGGGGSHAGPIDSAEGTNLVLSETRTVLPPAVGKLEYLALWNRQALPGMGVYILKGRGAGQWRRVVRQEGRTVEIDRPWGVKPDSSSLVGISTFQGNYLIVGNEMSDAGIAVQFFGVSIGNVVAGNISRRAGGFHIWGLFYGGFHPSWYCQVLDNEVPEGNGLSSPVFNTPPSLDSHLAILGGILPDTDVTLNLASVVRRNRLHNNGHVDLLGTVKDVVVEHNRIENSDVGINIETMVAGALLRENTFLDVDQPVVHSPRRMGQLPGEP